MLVTAEIKVITNGLTTGHLAMVQRLTYLKKKIGTQRMNLT